MKMFFLHLVFVILLVFINDNNLGYTHNEA